MQKITPFIWFDKNAEEAMNFYAQTFPDVEILSIERYPDESLDEHFKGMTGCVLTGVFQISGRTFMCLDGGPVFTPNPSVSFFYTCKDTEAIDRLWQQLTGDGKVLMELDSYPWTQKYGWVQDRFGVNWQLSVPENSVAESSVTPLLMFTKQYAGMAREAIDYYVETFKNSGVDFIANYEPGDPESPEYIKHAVIHLGDDPFMLMESSAEHDFVFNEAISFLVECEDQSEIDYYWQKLSKEPQSEQCGWCKDQFGVSWQIVPKHMGQLIKTPEAMKAMMNMKKIDIATLEAASKQ